MVRRSVRLAAVSLAALAAVPNDVFADPQTTHRASWTLSPERSSWGADKAETPRTPSLSGVFNAEIGWLKINDFRPGGGLQLDIAQSWVLCADWDRHRPTTPQVRETVDTFLLGLQYKFH
jgi:hypothetical protein